MSILDQIVKTIQSIRLVEIKNEIKQPKIAQNLNYQSPTNTTVNFNSITLNQEQLTFIANELSKNTVKAIENQVIGNIATDKSLQKELTKLSLDNLETYLKNAISSTATLSHIQPELLSSGGSLFPDAKELFKVGFEKGSKGHATVNNVEIINKGKNEVEVRYETKEI